MADRLVDADFRHRFINPFGLIPDLGTVGGRPALNNGDPIQRIFETEYDNNDFADVPATNDFFDVAGNSDFSLGFKLRIIDNVVDAELWGGDSDIAAPILSYDDTNERLLFDVSGNGGRQARWDFGAKPESTLVYVGLIAFDRTGNILRASNLKASDGTDISPVIDTTNANLNAADGLRYSANPNGNSNNAFRDAFYILGEALSQTDLDDTVDEFLAAVEYDLSNSVEAFNYSLPAVQGPIFTVPPLAFNRKLSNINLDLSLLDPFFPGNRKFSLINFILNINNKNLFQNRKLNSQPLLQQAIISFAPVLDNPIDDQVVTEGNLFDFTVPANTFSDPEAETLTLSASLDDDSPLPAWLSFVVDTFNGTPGNLDVGILNIKVTATDPFNKTAFDIFELTINEDLFLKTKRFNRLFKVLLPPGRAWNIDLSSDFKAFIDALMISAADVKDYFVNVKNDVFPLKTRSLELWEQEFLLSPEGLSKSERRSNLEAKWSAQGGQSPSYIESVILKLGIVAKVYENFNRDDPRDFLIGADSEILVNGDIFFTDKIFVNTCGKPSVTCNGDDSVTCGEYSGFTTSTKKYAVSVDSAKWIHYFIIADPSDVLTPLDVPLSLKKYLRLAILKIKPTQTRAVLNVNYV
jgi:uncharacterized protein YmfQ (DUF2313 family)